MNIFSVIISRVILMILGWKKIQRISPSGSLKKTILIYPHSTRFDYIMFLLSTWASYDVVNDANFKVIMSERYSWLFFLSSSIISAPDEYVRYFIDKGYTHNQSVYMSWRNSFLSLFFKGYNLKYTENAPRRNFVDDTVDKLKNLSSFTLLIAPSGSISDTRWKSGYFYLSRKLNCSVTVGGVDYNNKHCIIFKPKSSDNKYILERSLKKEFDTIARYQGNSVIDYPTFTSLICSLLIIPKMYNISMGYGIWSYIMSFISYYYHYSRETQLCKTDKFGCMFTFFLIYLYLYMKGLYINIFSNILFCLGFFYLGRSWGHTKPRADLYFFNHSLFHIFTTSAVYLLL